MRTEADSGRGESWHQVLLLFHTTFQAFLNRPPYARQDEDDPIQATRSSFQSFNYEYTYLSTSVKSLIHRRSTPLQRSECLLQRNHISRQFGKHSLQDGSIDVRSRRRRLNGVVCNHISARNQSVEIFTKLNNKKPPEDKTTTAKNNKERKRKSKAYTL